MQPISFLVTSASAALVLGLLAGAFALWCGSRYGQTEERYIIQYGPTMAAAGLFLYIDISHHIFWSFGTFNLVYLLTIQAGRKRNTAKRISN